MYILELEQSGDYTEIAIFDCIEDGRKFVSKIDGYEISIEDGFTYEYINRDKLPQYMEISFKGNLVPVSKFMFENNERISIIWKEISNLSSAGKGLVPGSIRVDAYMIENNEAENYIKDREQKYEEAKAYLEERGYSIERAYQGSEDGEAIIYKAGEEDDWHFLTHLDPSFLELDVKELIDEII